MPLIAAFDPGIALTGFAIVDGNHALNYGCIATAAHTPTGDRLTEIYRDVLHLLQEYAPAVVAYEKPYFGSANTNAAIVQYAVGALLMACAVAGYSEPITLNSSAVKAAATGKGNAPKTAIKPAVLEHFGLVHLPGTKDDAYDALAVAIAASAHASVLA